MLGVSCQKDVKTEPDVDKQMENEAPKSESEQLSTRIEKAYNIDKYKTETFLKYSVDVNLNDDTYAKAVLKYNILERILNVKANGVQSTMTNTSEKTEQEEFLFDLNEIYTLPFLIQNENFQLISKNDSIVTSKYASDQTRISYTINTHPLTEIIQSLNLDKDGSILDDTTINFEKFITVNRIPVSMIWNIYRDDKQIGAVNISRISYPKS